MQPWPPIEFDLSAAVEPDLLEKLASTDAPAIIFRRAFCADECARLVDRLIDLQFLYDAKQPVPEAFVEQSVPEGYHGSNFDQEASKVRRKYASTNRRIDVGSSLGYRGDDREQFFAHVEQTEEAFEKIFGDNPNPIDTIYDRLQSLSNSQKVTTAYEPDGRAYGPAIIRAHYGDYAYPPHFDSVRLREARTGYSVYRFLHQYAGVLLLQNSESEIGTPQCTIYRHLWQTATDEHLNKGTFREWAANEGIDKVEIDLDPGDLYFFNTRCIHEVPGFASNTPRIVIATFIGYSPDDPEIFVWS